VGIRRDEVWNPNVPGIMVKPRRLRQLEMAEDEKIAANETGLKLTRKKKFAN